jgi:UDP-GlcNAc3NAcA epimerase
VPVVLPLHPRTRKALEREGLLNAVEEACTVMEPVGYLDMLRLEKGARLVVTDSGGVQKEAFFFEVPCVTVRDETEWTELVDLGWNRLAPPNAAVTIAEAIRAQEGLRGRDSDLFGDGHASEAVAEILIQHHDAR